MLIFGCTFFFMFGILLVLVGANQAELARTLSLGLADTGLLMAGLSLGLGFGIIAGGRLAARAKRHLIFTGFCLLLAVSLLSVREVMSFQRAFLHILFAGVGAGTCMTFMNTMASEYYAERAAKAMAILHGSVTLGAVLGPMAIHALNEKFSWTSSFHLTGLLAMGLAVWVYVAHLPDHPNPQAVEDEDGAPTVLLRADLFFLALIGFCYVGIEAGIMTFAVPYASEALGQPALRGQSAISIYWLGILAARFGLLTLRGRIGSGVLLGSGGSAVVGLLFLALSHPVPIELATLLLGLCLGALYPVLLAHTGHCFAARRAAAIATVSAAGSLGGFTIPWATGLLGDQQGILIAASSLFFWTGLIAISGFALLRLQR